MSCEEARRRLDDYVDGALAVEERNGLAAHLDTCAACAGLAADLARMRDAARGLGPIAPPDAVWRALAERVRSQAPTAMPATPARPAPRRRAFVEWAGLAAALVLVTAAAVILLQQTSPPATETTRAGGGNADAQGSVKTIEDELLLADRLYGDAIGRLETIANENAGSLDPAIAASLRRNQAVLDRAIAESRAALEQNPADVAARDSLFGALRSKLGLLQDTVVLVNQMAPGGSRTTDGKSS